jgi:hypothetical protein
MHAAFIHLRQPADLIDGPFFPIKGIVVVQDLSPFQKRWRLYVSLIYRRL